MSPLAVQHVEANGVDVLIATDEPGASRSERLTNALTKLADAPGPLVVDLQGVTWVDRQAQQCLRDAEALLHRLGRRLLIVSTRPELARVLSQPGSTVATVSAALAQLRERPSAE